MMAALDELRRQGTTVNDSDLPSLTPLRWEHRTFHGSYHVDLQVAQQPSELRPLRLRQTPPEHRTDDDIDEE
jgi:hypothetical protein